MTYDNVTILLRIEVSVEVECMGVRKPSYGTMKTADVPHSRNGKHKHLVGEILADLDQLREGSAMKIPLADLGDTKERVRAALNRATRKAKLDVATASDDLYLYVWNK